MSRTAALSACLFVKSASKVRGKMCAAFSEVSELVFQRGLRQQLSGAVRLPVAVSGGSRVNGALGLKSRLVLAGGLVVALAAVPDAVEEIDGETCWRDERRL